MISAQRLSVLDVRRASEFAGGHLEGAANIAHTRLLSRLAELPRDRALLVHCQGGVRSARACALLERHGFQVTNMAGGYAAYAKARTSRAACPAPSACVATCRPA
jgi:hydroxyacylglutathione hydrolase